MFKLIEVWGKEWDVVADFEDNESLLSITVNKCATKKRRNGET